MSGPGQACVSVECEGGMIQFEYSDTSREGGSEVMTDRHYLFLTCDAGRTLVRSLTGAGCYHLCLHSPFSAALSACVWSLPILSLALAGWRVPHCLCRPPTPLLLTPLVPVSRSKAANQGWPAPGAGAGVCCIIDG